MPALVCPICQREMRVVRRDGPKVVTEHDCEPETRKDAPRAPAPGTADGERRYG